MTRTQCQKVQSDLIYTRASNRSIRRQYPLKNSAILDSGTIIHMFNEIARITSNPLRTAASCWQVITKFRFKNMKISTYLKMSRIMRLFDVAHRLASNIVSLRQLHSQGYWCDSRPDRNVLRRLDDSTVAKLLDRRDQFVLETTMCKNGR